MIFFTSSADLEKWVKTQESPDSAAQKIIGVIGEEKQQDIVQTCRSIFEEKDSLSAAKVLYQILSKYNLVEIREGNMQDKMIKQAQIMRQPGEYNMPFRVCPKLPYSVGKRLISTYNCRHYCLDSIVLDDDPDRVYCAESMWRRHVMDKFSREFKDKDGKWVGGYINERFQVFHDDGGNQMELANGERTRKPRPHQFSTERRLEEGRGAETTDLTASSQKIVKIASVNKDKSDDKIYQVFDDILEMTQSGLSDEDIISKTAEHYDMDILSVASIHKMAVTQLKRSSGVAYAYDNSKMTKSAQVTENVEGRPTFVTRSDMEVLANGMKTMLETNTTVVEVGPNKFQITSGKDAGKDFSLINEADKSLLGAMDDIDGMIQEAADETMLNEPIAAVASDDFPIIET